MFEQPLSHKIIMDAVIRALLLTILSDLLLTGYIAGIPVLGTIVVLICTFVPVISGWLFTKSENKNKRILGFALLSFLLGHFLWLVLMLLSVAFKIRLFPTDYMSNASPILFLMVIPCALLCTALLRIIVFSCFLIRNIKKR